MKAVAATLNKGKPYSAAIIDESSLQAVVEVLPTLATDPERVWLVGDDYQLRPRATDDAAKNAGLDISWMEFLRMT